MFAKLAVAAALSAAFTTSAFASQRGLPADAGCTHCLPGVVTGGAATVSRGRVAVAASPEAPVGAGARPPVARKVAVAEVVAGGRAVVAAECGCATGACPMHGHQG
jgi:hypothetical protein